MAILDQSPDRRPRLAGEELPQDGDERQPDVLFGNVEVAKAFSALAHGRCHYCAVPCDTAKNKQF